MSHDLKVVYKCLPKQGHASFWSKLLIQGPFQIEYHDNYEHLDRRITIKNHCFLEKLYEPRKNESATRHGRGLVWYVLLTSVMRVNAGMFCWFFF